MADKKIKVKLVKSTGGLQDRAPSRPCAAWA